MLRIGVPRGTKAREARVAATLAAVEQLAGLGYDVAVGSGEQFPDDEYAGAGAAVRTTTAGTSPAGRSEICSPPASVWYGCRPG